jgi:hypothetical protein
VEVDTLERFFAPLTDVRGASDPEAVERAGRFAALRHLLTTLLANPVLYRVGTVEVTVLLVGQSADGATLGLRTTMVAT